MKESDSRSNVFYLFKDASVFIRLVDRFTALHGVNFKTFVESILLNNSRIRAVCLDLSETQYLDSTFMGTLVHVKNMCSGFKKTFKVINPSEKVFENLKSLGLEKILKIENREETFKKSEMRGFFCYNEQKHKIFKSVLESHILLSSINKENKKEFCKLIKRLKKEGHKP
ncbi:STAS domain-containing protein [Borrelia sp. BU AG58]|uniref:STAS domain-containing protein n=1 Tax=Borrelia sp. BU AG58 TaxID=2887345 RepID=UPI001E5030B7|nr:STAS domain-containing protein [Borrelia sp. BU AG58]UER67939.1 STAS domain-containing protein [Borrelia sp. BU AG58]